MSVPLTITPIAHMRSDFPEKFGIPRQSNLLPGLRSTIVFTEAFQNPDALRGLEEYSHLWLIWGFSANKQAAFSPTVRPPRLGGNTRLGVFATRSPFRPNGLGLSCVEISSIALHTKDGPLIHVLGADLMDGTPIYDIKPYLPYADARPGARSSFEAPEAALEVQFPDVLPPELSEDDIRQLRALLALDPRPSYQSDPTRVYGLTFRAWDVKFTVCDGVLSLQSMQHKATP